MTEKLSWSVAAGSAGGSIADSGNLEVEAVTKATVDVAYDKAHDLALQLDDVVPIALLVVTSSRYADDVVVATDTKAVTLTEPLVLFGDAVQLLGDTLETLTLKNGEGNGEDPKKNATFEILLGRKLIVAP